MKIGDVWQGWRVARQPGLNEDEEVDQPLPQGAGGRVFMGSPCTKDCSGHKAGYEWWRVHRRIPQTASPSFNMGAILASEDR